MMTTKEYMNEMELLTQYEELGTVEELKILEETMKLIPCAERKPETSLETSNSYLKRYISKPVLIQTQKGDFFVATYTKEVIKTDMLEKWFSYGTGGRRMRVVSKVIGWCYLPESIA